jgi:hypothetical protein
MHLSSTVQTYLMDGHLNDLRVAHVKLPPSKEPNQPCAPAPPPSNLIAS